MGRQHRTRLHSGKSGTNCRLWHRRFWDLRRLVSVERYRRRYRRRVPGRRRTRQYGVCRRHDLNRHRDRAADVVEQDHNARLTRYHRASHSARGSRREICTAGGIHLSHCEALQIGSGYVSVTPCSFASLQLRRKENTWSQMGKASAYTLDAQADCACVIKRRLDFIVFWLLHHGGYAVLYITCKRRNFFLCYQLALEMRSAAHNKHRSPFGESAPAHMRLCWLSHPSRGQGSADQGCRG
jgi:hypothetical protein